MPARFAASSPVRSGACLGTRRSPHDIQLPDKPSRGELVFEKLSPPCYVLAAVHPLAAYKAWIPQLVAGQRCPRSLKILHRDLRIDNFVSSKDGSRLVICDLESRWGSRPSARRETRLQGRGWTERTKASDICDVGVAIKGMIYGNTPISNLVEGQCPLLWPRLGRHVPVTEAATAVIDNACRIVQHGAAQSISYSRVQLGRLRVLSTSGSRGWELHDMT